jgi:hypothetical protein
MQRTPSFARLFTLLVCLSTFAFATRAEEKKGLYADEGKDKTTGDLKDQDYWWAKWDAKMLEEAIKTRQPEGPISINVAVALRRLEPLVKKYPKHEDLKKWQTRFEEIDKKLDPNANRTASWKPGFPWDMSNYAQAWVNWHYGKMLADDNDVELAVAMYQNVVQNFKLISEREDTLFKEMPEECHKFVQENKPKAEKILADLKKKG